MVKKPGGFERARLVVKRYNLDIMGVDRYCRMVSMVWLGRKI